MNNLSSYCGLDDEKIRASDKDLHVHNIWLWFSLETFFVTFDFRGNLLGSSTAHLTLICLQIQKSQTGHFKASGDLVQVATESGKLTRLLKDITDLELVEKFKSIEAATIFAPSDDVFEKLPEGTIENLTKEQKLAITSR